MSEYLKPQSPLKHKDGAYIYPLTTADQVILENGNRLNTALNDMSSKPKAGFIYPLASSVVPDGFLLCDGAEYGRTEFPELFAAIGTIYGAGDGSTTFNVPNLQTRVPVGAGESYELGSVGGEAEHTLTVDEMPSHNHSAQDTGTTTDLNTAKNTSAYSALRGVAYSATQGSTGYTNSTGGSQPHNNMPPYTVVNYIIATGKDTGVSVSDIVMGAQALPLEVQYGGTGATTLKDVRQNLGINARNLLDNSDFRNPVNQRGQTSYKNTGYTIDRWLMWIESGNGSLTVHNGYISIMFENHGTIVQYLEKGVLDSSKTYTLAVKKHDGGVMLSCPAYISYGENADTITLADLRNGDVMNVEWAALYEGEYTAETLPEYQPKGYGAELAECLRYYYQSWNGAISGNGGLLREAFHSSRLINVELPCEMRVTPTIKIYKTDGTENAVGEYVSSTAVGNVSVVYVNSKSFIPSQANGGFTVGKIYSLHYTASADL